MAAKRKIVKSERRYLVESEVEALMKAAGAGRHGARDRTIAALLFFHGMRASELCGLKLSDLDMDAGRIYVRRAKGSLSTTQPLNGYTLRVLRKWLAQRGESAFKELILSERGEPFSRFGLNYLVAAWGERAGLAFHVHPHMLRHSCGYALVNKDGGSKDLRLIQDYLGHRDPRHTAGYSALSSQRFEELWG